MMEKETDRVYMIDDPEIKKQIIHRSYTSIPHSMALGLEFIELRRNVAVGKLPYQKKLVGNIVTGAVHTGVLISLIDSIAGLSVFCALPEYESFATLDLRIDCFKPSSPNQDLFAFAECYKLTRTIAFVRGSIYHNNEDDPIAGCVASFFRSGKFHSFLQSETGGP
ncbi:MAG: PaaI family thioesterase [SAR324 cluster bacterium]|nr:PaaI family thioesterase [SAR324 cluster bacterium]